MAARPTWSGTVSFALLAIPVKMYTATRSKDISFNQIEKSTGGSVNAIKAGYQLNGVPISGGDYFTTAFVAPFGVAAMTSPHQQAWLDKIYLSVRTRHEDYYEDSITLMCLLVMTENFWDPTLLP